METNDNYTQENPHKSSNRVVIGVVLVIAGFFLVWLCLYDQPEGQLV